MLIRFDEDRPSDSALVERVWRCHSEASGSFLSVAESGWEMVVTRLAGRRALTLRGPSTRATEAVVPAGGEWLAIRFRLGTFLTGFEPARLSDGRAVTLPDASSRSFWLDGSALEYPDYENAETFVDRLRRRGWIGSDVVVADAIRGAGGRWETRTVERHFRRTAGVTRGVARQIRRARFAARRLREGAAPVDVAFEAGYFDQAHLVRSLRRFVGQTPGEVLRGTRQLSFLYKTEGASSD